MARRPRSADPAVRVFAAHSARTFRVALHRNVLIGEPTGGRCIRVLAEPLTGRQRDSRDAWVRTGLSRFDATMLAIGPAMRPGAPA